MKMKPKDIEAYPRLARYVRVGLPKIVHIPNIMSAYHEITKVTPDILRGAVQWGRGPDLEVLPILSQVRGAYGWCPPPGNNGENPNIIFLDGGLVKQFESGPEMVPVANNRQVRKLAAVLLHELAHWASYEMDTDDPKREEGEVFERMVYGYRIP